MPIPQSIVNSNECAPRFLQSQNVARSNFHLNAAMSAAKQIRFQYSKPSKNKLVHECLDQLQAFLASSKGVRP
ncbi:hypothetical protein [Pseudomonas rhodesiae]|uniref:Uncharacterized protein n=1 Tax=Pseudomonas rhodesiae TaxID=76760 RepID=A0AAE8KYG4_9PSED|nr:hypothetical protein [Pseudomonas rhodesiae]TWR53545.1 hypothetical protein FIV35_17655 [Pseudomonas rhodesiae]SDU97671.1 hypothetical protein SAMN04490209_1394 [Pseudomonas rhodesiae]